MLYSSETLEKILWDKQAIKLEKMEKEFFYLISSVLSIVPYFGLPSHLEVFTSHTG